MILRAFAITTLLVRVAHAECPPGQAPTSCALHDEAVELFKAGKYDQASTKFRAAIAAGPTARSYLGYSQSVEEQGKLALAYETMLVAQKLSNDELAKPGAQADPEVVGRAERIKYKIAELAAKIGYVWLRLPEGVPRSRVVAVYREGEGDLVSPFGRWIVVAPTRQVMFAALDDGTRAELVANVQPGGQGTIVLPIAPIQKVAARPFVPPDPTQPPPTTEPVDDKPQGPRPPASTIFAVDGAFVGRNAGDVGFGLGFAAQFERKIVRRLAVSGRAAIVFHPSSERGTPPLDTTSTDATEVLFAAGVRTRSKTPLYAGLELGALLFDSTTTTLVGGFDSETTYSHTYPAALLGGGVRIGKVHLETYLLAAINSGDFDLPVRFFVTLGVDLFRR